MKLLPKCLLLASLSQGACFGQVGPEMPAIADFETLRGFARKLATQPAAAATPPVPKIWQELAQKHPANLEPLAEGLLWNTQDSNFAAVPLYPTADAQVQVWTVEKAAGQLSWVPERYDLATLGVPAGTAAPAGFGGVRVYTPLTTPPAKEPWWQYTQAEGEAGTAPGLEFGVSSRPLAIQRGGLNPPEYPVFRHLWILKPTAEERVFQVFGLIDVPELTAAVKYRLHPGRETAVEVECDVTLRRSDFRLGYAAGQGFFSHAEAALQPPSDLRPELHSTDGLLIHYAEQEATWRTFGTTTSPSFLGYEVEKFWGYGLLQRDRNAEHYQDLDTAWEKQISWYAEPVGDWPAGRIHLLAFPPAGTPTANIHVFWKPLRPFEVGKPHTIQWRSHWTEDVPLPRLAKVTSTRTAARDVTAADKKMREVTYSIEFSPLQSGQAQGEAAQVNPFIEIDDKALMLSKKLRANPHTGGWRVETTVAYPETTNTSEIGCQLLLNGHPMSEKWHFVWKR